MDLEIRTGLLESRKLNTLMEITIPRDMLLLEQGAGTVVVLPQLPRPLPLLSDPGGAGQMLCWQPSVIVSDL